MRNKYLYSVYDLSKHKMIVEKREYWFICNEFDITKSTITKAIKNNNGVFKKGRYQLLKEELIK